MIMYTILIETLTQCHLVKFGFFCKYFIVKILYQSLQIDSISGSRYSKDVNDTLRW